MTGKGKRKAEGEGKREGKGEAKGKRSQSKKGRSRLLCGEQQCGGAKRGVRAGLEEPNEE